MSEKQSAVNGVGALFSLTLWQKVILIEDWALLILLAPSGPGGPGSSTHMFM